MHNKASGTIGNILLPHDQFGFMGNTDIMRETQKQTFQHFSTSVGIVFKVKDPAKVHISARDISRDAHHCMTKRLVHKQASIYY